MHFDDTSFTSMDIALTLAARKFSPAQPFCNRYPRFRIHRSHEYDEEEFFKLFPHPFPTISAHFFCMNLTSSCISCVPQFFVSTQKRTKSLHFSRKSSFLSRISFFLHEIRRPANILYSKFFPSAVAISCLKVTSKWNNLVICIPSLQ